MATPQSVRVTDITQPPSVGSLIKILNDRLNLAREHA